MSSALYWRDLSNHLRKGRRVSSFLSKLEEAARRPTNASSTERDWRVFLRMAAASNQRKPMKQTTGTIKRTYKRSASAAHIISESNRRAAASTTDTGSHQSIRSGDEDGWL